MGSTMAGVERSEGVALWGRRLVLLLIAVVVLLGVSGLLGPLTTTMSSTTADHELSVRYADVARAGLDVPWEVTVTSPDGFDDDVELSVTASYFDIFESQGFLPEPSEMVRDGDLLLMTFDAPDGNVFRVSYDAYIQPSSQVGRDGTVTLLVDGREAVAADFRTRLVP